ncbi:MAG: Gfo/Idh/MocA family oxidoreductase [Phycisphaeraceae bacterium]|nr:MAG: Gfo/Idh/MocA family oxidoreductase [Phycisphaeraceae bacterium]
MSAPRVRVALFGTNGHQIHAAMDYHPDAELVAVADVPDEALPESARGFCTRVETLDELIAMDNVDLIVLCSPVRGDQHEHAIACLMAGKHVYAEKPSALHEVDLDRIIEAATSAGRVYREMAGTAFEQPFLEMRNRIAGGLIGEVRQVVAQKSYPLRYPDRERPRGEIVDGGIVRQVGVHAARFIEHVAGRRIVDIRADATEVNGLALAASMTMTLDNGGCATIALNYLNPPAFPLWGNEMLRVFGDEGFCEITDGGQRTRVVLRDTDLGPLTPSAPSLAYHDLLFRHIRFGEPMPLTLDEELHPTRVVIRAAAQLAGR